MRECRICGIAKEDSEYYADGSVRGGLMTKCKACHRAVVGRRRRGLPPAAIDRPLDVRLRRAAMAGPPKRCGACGETMGAEGFTRDRHEPDGRSWACRGCQSGRRTLSSYANRRSHVTSPNLLDNCDRAERRAELEHLGGLLAVRSIRLRIRAARKAKSILCGAEIPGEVLSSLLSRSERRS